MISLIVAIILLSLAKIISPTEPNYEKNSPFECGFQEFSSSRETINIRFFLIALLFVIFDLEISLIVPLNIIIQKISINVFFYFFSFIVILTVGLIYEWKKGALNWQ